MPGYMSAWSHVLITPSDSKRMNREAKIATENKLYCLKGSPTYTGKPQGPKAKGHKTPATGTLPYVRRSVIG